MNNSNSNNYNSSNSSNSNRIIFIIKLIFFILSKFNLKKIYIKRKFYLIKNKKF